MSMHLLLDHHEIRLLEMSADGDLVPLDAVTGSWSTKALLFHPSGRFLYVSYAAYYEDRPVGLSVYAIDAQGRLALVQTLEDGGGHGMAVTIPQVRASASVP
jgi:hypothetical protein